MTQGKNVLVTGGSRGIGAAIVRRLAGSGWRVTFTYQSNEDAARGVAEATGAQAVKLDLCSEDDCRRVVEGVVETGLDALVNNAGYTIDNLLLRYKPEDIAAVVDANLIGTMRLCRLTVKTMMKARAGRIVNMTSVVGEAGNPGQTAYAAAKAGIIGFTKALAREVASRNVLVNAVSPGFIDTDMTKGLSDEVRAKLLANVPLGRMGTADDVAGTVSYLLSDDSRYVTGQVLRVNGGLYV